MKDQKDNENTSQIATTATTSTSKIKTVEMKNITKVFGNFVANDNISLTVHKGEVLALLGENGAGKSTLMNLLYGIYRPSSGEIFINGHKVDIDNPSTAIKLGIGMVHQHFMLVPTFTVAENIVLGQEPLKKSVPFLMPDALGILDMKKAIAAVEDISKKFSLFINPMTKIEDLSVGQQQRVEILKMLYRGAEILILDEPTAVLTPQEIFELAKIIKNLSAQGKTIIIITHKLKEIKEMADYCTVIRRGKYIDTLHVPSCSERDLAEKMVGRDVVLKVAKKDGSRGKTILKIENLKVKDNRDLMAVNGLNLEVAAGEIVGLIGVDGNGQSELVEAITGLRRAESGSKVIMNDVDITNKTPREVFLSKIATIPEDRQKHGLVLDFSVQENMILQTYCDHPFSKLGILDHKSISNFAKELIRKFDIRPDNHLITARSLSGGNQQKIIIAREVTHNPDLLIAVQPTRGLDVGAIEYVHKALIEQRDKGKAVFLVSLELDEVLNVSDRIAVIYHGQIMAIFNANQTDEKQIGILMGGGGTGAGGTNHG